MIKSDWIWMGHPAHFIGASNCQFVMATKVGHVIVSTVGEYVPYASKYAQKPKFEHIGWDRKYETMVFEAKPQDEICCPWQIIVDKEVDFQGYMTSGEAYLGHLQLCEKWSKKGAEKNE